MIRLALPRRLTCLHYGVSLERLTDTVFVRVSLEQAGHGVLGSSLGKRCATMFR